MGDVSATVLAAQEGGTSNFLIPNGTFFVVLIIFLIVLGVIGTFVVPPIMRVLGERENMVTQTTENNRKADRLFAAAEADYQELMKQARSEATGIRDEARAEGRKILEQMRARTAEEVAAMLQAAEEQMKQQADAIAAELRSSVETLAATLASRVLGVEVRAKTTTTAPGR
jgi:F-type H+-transporting ATPase subunit b